MQNHLWAHTPAIHAASDVDHFKRVAWVSVSVHASGSVPIVMLFHLVAILAAHAPLLTAEYPAVTKNFLKQYSAT